MANGKEAEREGKSGGDAVEDAELEKEEYPRLAEKKARGWNALWLLRRREKGKISSFLESSTV